MSEEQNNKANLVIEVDDNTVLSVSTDKPEVIGNVVVIDKTPLKPEEVEELQQSLLTSPGYEGMVGYQVLVEEDKSIGEVMKEILTAEAAIAEDQVD